MNPENETVLSTLLVDFERKQLSDNRPPIQIDSTLHCDDDEDEWTDYVDAFGRSRRCLKTDVPLLMEKDRELKATCETEDIPSTSNTPFPQGSDEERLRLQMREKWNKEEQQNLEKGDVHYQDILYDGE